MVFRNRRGPIQHPCGIPPLKKTWFTHTNLIKFKQITVVWYCGHCTIRPVDLARSDRPEVRSSPPQRDSNPRLANPLPSLCSGECPVPEASTTVMDPRSTWYPPQICNRKIGRIRINSEKRRRSESKGNSGQICVNPYNLKMRKSLAQFERIIS